MNVLKWTKGLKSGSKKETPNDVELQNVEEGTAFERVSNLETDSKWPGSSSASGSPSASRKELRKAIKKNLVHCDVLDDSGVESPKQMLAKRGYRMQDDVLGEGGFGKVILVLGARQDRLTLDSEQTNDNNEQNIKYACKIIDASDKFRKRLREFGNELSGLNAGHSHPNIIQLYDAFIIDRKFYIIMELGDGVRNILNTCTYPCLIISSIIEVVA